MVNLNGLSIPMIMGDWKLIIETLEEKLAKNTSVNLDDVSEDEAAEICEEMDKLEVLLVYLKKEFEKEYGSINL
ncbi:hypothetical protein [Sessilibacter corallicola]|uniref:hypothetical protein n=1 Tax=Sessilibacter corallicola TaxID=2904075 RepID=UPI001E2C93CE|nr:hypothetical protein [Sessilibacter corallicola]MCE2029826.1 hypothetical protein [Sessilibacter corallicola]